MNEKDDYGNDLAESIANPNVNTRSLFSDNYTPDIGIDAPAESVAAPFPGLDTDPNTNPNTSTDANSPVKKGDVFVNKTDIPIDFSGIKKLITDNKNLITAGGAALGLMGGNDAKYGKTGYQGTIPNLTATRQMLTAPPKTNPDGTSRRPGSGGINYGGDVTYTRAPGQDPWVNLSGTKNDGEGIDKLVNPPTDKPAAAPANLGSKGYQAFIAAGKTPQEYLGAINQWITDNPNASYADISAAMRKFNVTEEDLQAALTSSNFSDATKYFMTHGEGGIKELNDNVLKWIQDNPFATKEQIAKIVKDSGVDVQDISRALGQEDKLSKLMEDSLKGGLAPNEVYENILKYQSENHTPEEIADMMKRSGATEADIAMAAKYAEKTGYKVPAATSAPAASGGGGAFNIPDEQQAEEETAPPAAPPSPQDVVDLLTKNAGADDEALARMMKEAGISDKLMAEVTGLSEADIAARRMAVGYAAGGMAKGRYLQGETDGMADKLPAQIGNNQPAALSHGEFVIPADVVSHMGNGNSDAGAKKLYQMMDRIRMARTGTKKQGKKINPDKFMLGGLASSEYASGGSVKHFLTGGSTTAPANTTGVESNLSNWAGDYVTNMLGQGQALANSPYQAYTGPLTAGQSALQTKVSTGLQGINFPGNLGKSFTGTDAPTIGADGKPVGGGGIASQYMNPYLESVLNPQLDELQRRSKMNLQPDMAKLTQAGGFGGSRQALMMGESGRNLLQEQNKTVGQGYSNAFDKGMQQFNTEQGQAKTLVDMMSGVGATDRAIDAEGIAADKTQFEEARANPYKMVQFQQSLLSGLPLAAQSYNIADQSSLQKAAAGATTVADLIDILSGKKPAKKI